MHDIRGRLREGARPSITVLPDGSIDRRFAIINPEGDELTRERVGREIVDDAKSFLTRPLGTEPGGQSVNAAMQVHELGAKTTLVGHLDHNIFASLPFGRYSMGTPAEIMVYELADGALMFAAESADIESWTFSRFERSVGTALDSLLHADALLWTNWAAFPHATDALVEMNDTVTNGNVLVIDPGAVSTRSTADIVDLLETLSNIEYSFNVVLSPNLREAEALAKAAEIEATNPLSIAEELRDEVDIDAVVVHDDPESAVATTDETLEVPTFTEVVPTTHVGAGDRFSAGVAFGQAVGWSWEETLSLGNACATHYLLHGRTGEVSDLESLIGDVFTER